VRVFLGEPELLTAMRQTRVVYHTITCYDSLCVVPRERIRRRRRCVADDGSLAIAMINAKGFKRIARKKNTFNAYEHYMHRTKKVVLAELQGRKENAKWKDGDTRVGWFVSAARRDTGRLLL
jgi:hypothetical protein